MKVLKVIKENIQHRVYIVHNGMKASYLLEESMACPRYFNKELDDFRKCFFDFGEEDWMGVDTDVKGFFADCMMLRFER